MLASFSQAARQDAPEVTPGGLHLVPDTRLGLVYADPEADLSGYSRILLMDAQVAFKKDWQRDINQARPFNVTNEDMERIKTGVADMFREIFTEALTSGGYVLTEEQAPDVLIVRPAIFDLNVRSPESSRATTTRNLSESAGDMTLYLELRDSVTGDILIKAMDFQFDRTNVTPFMMDRTRNETAARRLLSNWAEVLVKGLDEVRAATSGR
jgi:hypothetical protein